MSIALSGAHNMFGCLQNAILNTSKSRVDLNKGVHQALDDFCWITKDLTTRLVYIDEIIPLDPFVEGHHNVSGLGAGGVCFPGDTINPQFNWRSDIPVVWRLRWPHFITNCLVTSTNPNRTITNSDL